MTKYPVYFDFQDFISFKNDVGGEIRRGRPLKIRAIIEKHYDSTGHYVFFTVSLTSLDQEEGIIYRTTFTEDCLVGEELCTSLVNFRNYINKKLSPFEVDKIGSYFSWPKDKIKVS